MKKLIVTSIALSTIVMSSVSQAVPFKKALTVDQFGLFSSLQEIPGYFCFDNKGAPILGTIGGNRIKAKAIFQATDLAAKERENVKLRAQVAKIKNKQSSSYKLAVKKLTAATTLYKNLLVANDACAAIIDKKYPPIKNPPINPGPVEIIPSTSGDFVGSPVSLQPYRERISRVEVRHLLDKVAFGGSLALEKIGIEQGLTPLVEALLADSNASATQDTLIPPRDVRQGGIPRSILEKELTPDDIFWAKKSIWYNHPDRMGVPIWGIESIQHPQMYRFIKGEHPLAEWMLLNLNGHFATNLNAIFFSRQPYYHYGMVHHWNLLKYGALGNFDKLAETMAFDPAMNYWLNNKDNIVGNPNQNYGREMMELFLLGTSNIYTGEANYGEESVIASTAFVSGFNEISPWGVPLDQRPQWVMPYDDLPRTQDVIDTEYTPSSHDNNPYNIFPNIPGANANTNLTHKGHVANILFNHPSAGTYIADRFAGTILYPGLPGTMVNHLSQTLVNNDYEMRPFLREILKSEAMFSRPTLGACIDSPIEHNAKLARKMFQIASFPRGETGPLPGGLDNSTKILDTLVASSGTAGQKLFEPPSVFGWKGSCNINRNGTISMVRVG